MYVLAIFLVHCGGFSVIGQTNFDVASTGSMLAVGAGATGASINAGLGTYVVAVPSASYHVTANDVGRILALRSSIAPRANSGLFRVTAATTASNSFTIDYRSIAAPPTELSMSWRLFENERSASLAWRSGSNGTTGYGSWNASPAATATASRIALQSPHRSAWQARLCLESVADVSGAVPSVFSIAPGFGAGSDGDFRALPAGSTGHDQQLFLHGALWNNTTSSLYRGMTVGLTPCLGTSGSLWCTGQWRISMMVDDVSGSCSIVNRNVNLPVTNTSGSGWCAVGLTHDEVGTPVGDAERDPTINVSRLFVAGSSTGASRITWDSQFHVDNNVQVVGWSRYGYPIPGVLSSYSDISNPGNTHVRYASGSADTPWASATELLDVEVLLGTVDQTLSAGTLTTLFRIQPRRLGRLPMLAQGRANHPTWKVTSDVSSSWYHTEDGVYLEWGGPIPTDGTGGSNFLLNTSSQVLQQGLVQYGDSLVGSDPVVPTNLVLIKDLDAARLRKTYSYLRQPSVDLLIARGGSNPAKP